MRIRNSQTGIGHVLVVLVILFVAVAGFAGYTVWQAGQKADTASQSDVPSTAIKTKADLQNASKLLDTTATQLDKDLDASVLDSDIDQLL